MTRHHARLIVVAVAAVSFSTPITAQQEPTSPPTVETLVETLRGNVNQNEQGEVVEVYLTKRNVSEGERNLNVTYGVRFVTIRINHRREREPRLNQRL